MVRGPVFVPKMWNSVENRFNEMFLFIPILTWIPTSFLELTSLFLSVQELISAAEEMWIETNFTSRMLSWSPLMNEITSVRKVVTVDLAPVKICNFSSACYLTTSINVLRPNKIGFVCEWCVSCWESYFSCFA